MIQECLTNIVRHADASQVGIELNMQKGFLYLSIKDDGKGCDMTQIQSGFGLLGMQERIKTLGGELKISSEVRQGRTITALIPQ